MIVLAVIFLVLSFVATLVYIATLTIGYCCIAFLLLLASLLCVAGVDDDYEEY